LYTKKANAERKNKKNKKYILKAKLFLTSGV